MNPVYRPMLATLVDSLDKQWVFETKWDGPTGLDSGHFWSTRRVPIQQRGDRGLRLRQERSSPPKREPFYVCFFLPFKIPAIIFLPLRFQVVDTRTVLSVTLM
jgi:hypothetical protein